MTPTASQAWATTRECGKEQSSGSINRRSRSCEHIFSRTGRASAASIRTRPRASIRAVPRAAPLAFLFTLAAIMFPQAAAQFCPFFKNPTDIVANDNSVREDVWIPMQKAWRNVPGQSDDDRRLAGMLWHGECVSTICGTCKGTEKARDGTEKAAKDDIRIEYSVQYGRLFLRPGYLTACPGAIYASTDFDMKKGDGVYSDGDAKAFTVTGTYATVNCTLEYLTFQGLRFANKMTHLAMFGQQATVTVRVAPPSTEGPTGTSLQYIFSTVTSSNIILDEVNTLPSLASCPKMSLENDKPTSVSYREQSFVNSPNLLSWSPESGGNRCKNTMLQASNRVLYPAPVPEQTAIHPMTIQPPFCQTEDEKIGSPPFCDSLEEAGHSACPPDPLSYMYHIEDYKDATLRIRGIEVEDKDVWTTSMNMTFSFKFKPEAITESTGSGMLQTVRINDPFNSDTPRPLNIEEGSGSLLAFCGMPKYKASLRQVQMDNSQTSSAGKWNQYCARSYEETNKQLVMINRDETKLRIRPTLSRAASTPEELGNCAMVEFWNPARSDIDKWKCVKKNHYCMVIEEVWGKVCDANCICNSKVAEGEQFNGRRTYNAYLFWELGDRNNQAKIYETGYMMIKYTNDTILDGTMWSDPGNTPYKFNAGDDQSLPFDWFRASPLKLFRGKISTSDSITFTVDASTKAVVNPVFELTVNTLFGIISLPGTPGYLVPALKTAQSIMIRGTINELNEALGVVEYRLPERPNFNTLSKNHSIYGPVQERIFLKLDDRGTAGTANPFGQYTIMEFNVAIVADNDAPVIPGPLSFYHLENSWFPLNNITVFDVDASDRLLPEETISCCVNATFCPKCPGFIDITELRLQFTSTFGRFRLDADALKRVTLLRPVPGSVRPYFGEQEPCLVECGGAKILRNYEQFKAIGIKTCMACLEDFAKERVASTGFPEVMIEGRVLDCNFNLNRAWYKGEPGYNLRCPGTGDAFTKLGKKTKSFDDVAALENIVITAMDLGNTGCTTDASQKTVSTFPVWLTPVETGPFMKLYQNDEDLCELCKSDASCAKFCPGGVPKCFLTESSTDSAIGLTFNEKFGPQIRDYDSRDVSFNPAKYTLYLQVNQGVLIISTSVTINDQQEVVSGLTYSKGTEGCKTCNEYELSGDMFALNKVLIGLTYKPTRFYNSRYGPPERLVCKLKQIEPKDALPLVSSFDLDVILYVEEGNDVPMVNFFADPKKPASNVVVKTKFHDFILLGGPVDRSEYCARSDVACFSLRDPDACESMYAKGQIIPDPRDTVAIQGGLTAVCRNTSINAGLIRMKVESDWGNLWFYTPDTIKQWPPDLSLLPELDPGKEKRRLDIQILLSQYVGGILRYYPSRDSTIPDQIRMEFDDNGNTGFENPESKGKFCCCTNAACDQCKRPAGSGLPSNCLIDVTVVACENVEGWTCKDSVKAMGSRISGYVVTIIVACVGFLVFAGVGFMIYQGHVTNSVAARFVHVAEQDEANGEKPTHSLFIAQHEEHTLAV